MQQLSLHYGPETRVRIARGPRASERRLLDELDGLLDGALATADLSLLARPVLLVVPSSALRRHLLARLLARRPRGSILGFECRTHLGLAATLVETGGDAVPAGFSGFDYFSLFARRLARRERALADSLDHLADGYGAVLAAVRDLLDAGFEPPLAEALDETLAAEGPAAATAHEIERARALLRVAAGTFAELERWDLGRSSDLLARAALVAKRRSLPLRRVLVYGFNDATGLTTDFLLALVSAYGGTVYLDHPPDPADRRTIDSGLAFSRNFRERIETGVKRSEDDDEPEPSPPRVDTFRALGAEAECREIARRIRRLLAAGERPETIGVVVRRLEDYAGPLRAQLARLAVPFSCDRRCGPFEPRAAPLHAVLQLLREGSRLPIERWLDAAPLAGGWSRRADLQLALHTLGAGRLEEAAALDLRRVEKRGGLALAAGRGFTRDDDEHRTPRLEKRWMTADRLAQAAAGAREVARAVDEWPARAPAGEHTRRLVDLLDRRLGWSEAGPAWNESGTELRRAAAAVPSELEIDFEELQLILGRQLADFGRGELGGKGGGVQVLDVTAARSLTFSHLFVLGLNRGVFPRQVREDPILTDSLRQVLARSGFGVLPDLPIKRNGFHEERYLFAQLLCASPRITLSWQEVDDQQKNLRAISPLIERLQLAAAVGGEELPSPTARPVFSPEPGADDPRPAWEAAVLAGLAGDRERFRRVLAVALAASAAAPAASELARARVAAIDEADPLLGDAGRAGGALERLGPWLGAVGAIEEQGDPRPASELFVTALEGLAKCPWKHFLQRVLKLERLPDPLETVPGINAQLIGQLVHDALQAIVERAIGDDPLEWEAALEASGVEVPWPGRDELAGLLLERARQLVARRDLGLPGLDRALVLAATPHLETARRLEWPRDVSRWPVVASEIRGHVDLPLADGEARRIRFRADRMDRTDRGFSFTDYKTGRWAPQGSSSASPGERLLDAVATGEWLQGAAYAMSGDEDSSRGRYLFLNPGFLDDGEREFSLDGRNETVRRRFARAAAAVLELWQHGGLFPRLVDGKEKEPRLCSFCDVSDACVRGDSGARRRLLERLESWRRHGASGARQVAVLTAWDLARPAAKKGRRR